jgi:hypothetical protein
LYDEFDDGQRCGEVAIAVTVSKTFEWRSAEISISFEQLVTGFWYDRQ